CLLRPFATLSRTGGSRATGFLRCASCACSFSCSSRQLFDFVLFVSVSLSIGRAWQAGYCRALRLSAFGYLAPPGCGFVCNSNRAQFDALVGYEKRGVEGASSAVSLIRARLIAPLRQPCAIAALE